MKRLLLVRHGESEANVVHSLDCTVPGPPLSPLGHKQAIGLVDALSGMDIRTIYASTMLRAQQTVAPLAQKLGLRVHVRDGFREFDVGDLNARSDRESHLLLDELMRRWLVAHEATAARPDGENAAEVIARFRSALVDVLASYDDGAAVVAAHGGALRLVVPELKCGVTGPFTFVNHVPNAGIIDVEVSGDQLKCRSWAGLSVVQR